MRKLQWFSPCNSVFLVSIYTIQTTLFAVQPGSVVHWRTTEGLTPATALRQCLQTPSFLKNFWLLELFSLKNEVFQQGFSFFVADLLENKFLGQDEALDKTNTKNNLYYSEFNETMQNILGLMFFWQIFEIFFTHWDSWKFRISVSVYLFWVKYDTAVTIG